uniref:Uncharacterized protein n=1 Tax=Hanusia phi TaxID=3032 RepID=A0A7S0HE55_9CRYP|mmetsp:Transcript_14828/g.34079  ORF Transcript_14828/g.34079 Transcript_14828/m.34079 type:complete len:244 (+) Transcript_14828:31-762(+)
MLGELAECPDQEQIIHDFKGSSSRYSRKLRRENSRREAQEMQEVCSPSQTQEDHDYFQNLEIQMLLGGDDSIQDPTGSDQDEEPGHAKLEDIQKFAGSSHRYARKLRREASTERAKMLACSAPDDAAETASEEAVTTAEAHAAFSQEERVLLGASPQEIKNALDTDILQNFAGSSARIDRKLRRQRSFEEAKLLSPTANAYSRAAIEFHKENERKEAELTEMSELMEGLVGKIISRALGEEED